MRNLLSYIFFLFSVFTFAQNTALATAFFEDGEYNKALTQYNKILSKLPYRTNLFIKKIKCLGKLQTFSIKTNEELMIAREVRKLVSSI